MNKSQKNLLSAVMLLSVVLMAVLFLNYRSGRRELSQLKTDLIESTDTWKQINEEKLIVQRELKEAKSELRDVELTISEDEEKIEKFENDIAELEIRIDELKSLLLEGG